MTKSEESMERLITGLAGSFADMLLVTQAIKTKPVEEAFRSVPRHLFVDRYYDYEKDRFIEVDPQSPVPDQLKKIYSNDALVSHRHHGIPTSSTSQPSLVADMLEQLLLESGMKVLEIGAGTGWNAALIEHIVAPRGSVYSIDIQEDVAQRARNHIQRIELQNVEIITGDGGYGHPESAPYDRIITTACCPEISPHWMEQLAEDGALLVTLRDMEGSSWCLLLRLWKRKAHLRGEVVGLPGFMTLQGKYGAKVVKPDTEERLKIIKAGRQPRSRAGPLGDIQLHPNTRKWMLDHLVFFAYLEGMSVERIGNQYVLSNERSESVCVIDGEQMEIYGKDDTYRDLAKITRKWIGLGAPRKNAYLVEAWPLHISKRKPRGGWLVKHRHTQLIFRLKRKHQVSFF